LSNRLRAWGPAGAWAALLFGLSALPELSTAATIPYGDKVAHLLVYSVFGALLAFGRGRSERPVPHVLLLLIGALYAVSDEWHQFYVPGRVPDVADWAADLVGLVAGYTVGIRAWSSRNAEITEEEA
jgi:VanZ family protein